MEQMTGLDFKIKEMAGRIKELRELEEKLRKNKFDLEDLLDQFEQINRMGSMKDILSMLPGVNKKIKDVDVDDKQIDYTMAIIRSMTMKERENPDIINPSRKRRIAAGCGSEHMGIFISTYCINGLICSTISGYGKIAVVTGFTFGNVVMSILNVYDYYMVISFTEILLFPTTSIFLTLNSGIYEALIYSNTININRYINLF